MSGIGGTGGTGEGGAAPSDEALFARLGAGGDRDALAALLRSRWGEAVALARRILGDPQEAEDAAQEAFVALVRAAPPTTLRGGFGPYLRALVANAAREEARSRGRRRAHEARIRERVARAEATLGAGAAGEAGMDRERLRAALARLPEAERAAITLHYWEGLPQAEVGAALGVPERTAQSRIRRGLERLRGPLGRAREEALAAVAGVGGLEGGEGGGGSVPASLAAVEALLGRAAASARAARGGAALPASASGFLAPPEPGLPALDALTERVLEAAARAARRGLVWAGAAAVAGVAAAVIAGALLSGGGAPGDERGAAGAPRPTALSRVSGEERSPAGPASGAAPAPGARQESKRVGEVASHAVPGDAPEAAPPATPRAAESASSATLAAASMPPVASGIDIEVRGLAPDMAAAALVSGGGGGGRRVEIASGLGRVDLAPGVYDVRFGWGSGERASMSVALGDPTWIERVAVPGGGRERIVAVASPDGERSGPTVVVREESGAPAADVSVDLERDPAQDEPLLPPGATLPAWLLRSRSTDRSGSVRFCRVPPGDYFIALDGVALGRFRLSGGAETVPLTRPRLPELRLEVEDENGVPLSYASVRVRSKASGISATLEADREGRCAAALPLGPIDVEVIPVGEDAGAALEAAHTGVPLRLVAPLRAGLTLEVTPPAGTVIQDGVPARAIIEHEGGSMSAEGRVEGGRVLLRFAGVRAEEDGSFRLLVRLGDYDGVVEAPLPPGRRLALTLPSLAKGSWLEGRVACSPELWDSLREEPSGIDGGPPARLRAVPAPFWGEGIISFLMEPLYGAPVGADGRFRVWLPAGSSTIEIVGSRASGPDDPGAIATPVRERRAVSPGERTQGRLAGDVRLETP